jgi:hypothetical protein
MNYRSRDRYCERPRWDRDSCGPTDRRDPPICWPQRSSNFPAISVSWPMPIIVPVMPWLGGWGTVRWSVGGPYSGDRRPMMYRDRSCESYYRSRERCCERCGCDPCRCERCDRCGYYDCRCQPCERCGCYDCRCERCARCGQRKCRCGGYYRSRRVEISVNAENVNWQARIDKEWFDADELPKLDAFTDKPPFKLTGYVQTPADVVKIKVTVALPPGNTFRGEPITYTAAVVEAHRSWKVLAHLTVTLY